MASVLIVDHDPDIRFLERMVLKLADRGFTVVGEAASGEEAIDCWRDLHPDVIVLEDRLPRLRGLDVARLILAEEPAQTIALLTASEDDAVAVTALDLGIQVCLPKRDLQRLAAEL
jgi:two-component system, chemotaxis family, chemotaxis protein CheY